MSHERIKRPFGEGLFDFILWSIRCGIRKLLHAIVCAISPKPPRGTPPTPQQQSKFLNAFPNLKTWSITGPATGSYNCIAWSVGISNQWIWPGNTVQDFDAFYASHGWTLSTNCNREFKRRKVALYANNSDPNDCTHGSRETHDCGWHESKCGGWERIMHVKTELEGGYYGNIIRCYEKADENANLDLC
jgi:hypothetical protein